MCLEDMCCVKKVAGFFVYFAACRQNSWAERLGCVCAVALLLQVSDVRCVGAEEFFVDLVAELGWEAEEDGLLLLKGAAF